MKIRAFKFARSLRSAYLLSIVLVSRALAAGQTRSVKPAANSEGAGRLLSTDSYSSAVDAGDYVYVSGQGPLRPDGSLPANFDDQVRQALNNVKSALESASLTMSMLSTRKSICRIREIWRCEPNLCRVSFPKDPPARAVLGVARVPEPPIEISAVAVRDLAGRRAVYPPDYDHSDSAAPGVLPRPAFHIGMEGIDSAKGTVPSDPAAQVDLALDRFQAVVKAAGLELANVVFVNPYLTTAIPGA